MKRDRIHIFGASGAGTSTLGRALAEAIDANFFDTDDFFWQPTDPPYQLAREPSGRQRLMLDTLDSDRRWVLSGSLCGWGDRVIPRLDLAIFILTSTEIRLKRLQTRERARFGDRLAPGGDMHDQHKAFLDWAAKYDDGTSDMRSLAMHEAWAKALACPVVRLDGSRAIADLLDSIRAESSS